jgi:predicted acetyltransferase
MLTIKIVDETNRDIFTQMSQDYEAEFSSITKKSPGPDGQFTFTDHQPGVFDAWIAFDSHEPIGFVVVGLTPIVFDIAEFYIKPTMRKRKMGQSLAFCIFDLYAGDWQVRQIIGAENARKFWLRVIANYTNGYFFDTSATDPDWGKIYIQTFRSATSGRHPRS